jgi:hypothetical protein
MSKTLFDEVIGTPPPSTVDVPAIVRRRRRTRTLRRVGIAVTSVVAVSAIVAASLSLAPGRGSRLGTGPATQSPDAIVAFGTRSPGVTPRDVSDALTQAVTTIAPDAQWAPDGQPRVVASPTAEEGAGAMFGGAGSLTRDGISRRVAVSIGPAGDTFACEKKSPEETCGSGLTPEGATMVIRQYWDPSHPEWITVWRVDLALADGLVLQGYAYASKRVEYGSLGPVLRVTELVRVVDDVASRLT